MRAACWLAAVAALSSALLLNPSLSVSRIPKTNTTMSAIETIQAKTKELFALLTPHRNSDVMQRVNLFCMAETGKKLPDFFNSSADEDTDDKKVAIADRLIAIVKAGSWQLLPAVPSGQAGGSAKTPTPPPPAPKPAAPAPKPDPKEDPKPADALVNQVTVPPPPPPKPAAPAAAAEEPEQDPAAQLAALIAKLTAKPAAKQLTRDEIRLIVREEIALVFNLAAGALTKK